MNNKYPNRKVINVSSPKNEDDYVNAYKELNKSASKHDDLDISAVQTISGERGHALLNQSINRGKDKNVHIGQDFISDADLRKKMNEK